MWRKKLQSVRLILSARRYICGWKRGKLRKKTKPLISGWDLAFLAFVLIGFYYWRNRNESEQEGNIEKHVVTKREELKLGTLQEFKLHAVMDEQELDEHENFLKDLELRSRKNR